MQEGLNDIFLLIRTSEKFLAPQRILLGIDRGDGSSDPVQSASVIGTETVR